VEVVSLSDHSLVAVDFNLRRSRPNICHVTHRNITAVDPDKLAKLIRSEKICTCLAVDTDAFADELDTSFTRVLNALAALCSRSVRMVKQSAK